VEVRRGQGALGPEILAVPPAAEEPLPPAQVHAALDPGLAYTTVMTVMVRLHRKSVLARCRTGHAFADEPAQDPAKITAWRVHRNLDVEPNRAAATARFVNDLAVDA
jgi:predicted transcriptional regulator